MKRLLWLMTAATMFSSLAVELIAPLYAVFVQDIGGGLVLAGATWAVYRLSSAAMFLVSGRLADRYPPERILCLGFGLRVVGTAGYLLVSEPVHLLLVQGVQGIAHALIGPSYRKIYALHTDKGHEGMEWAYPQAGVELGTGLAALAGGIIAASLGFGALFLAMLAAHICAFLLAIGVLRAVSRERSSERHAGLPPIS